jgi:hypothetical protein
MKINKGTKGKVDKLFSEIIRMRGSCERCHKSGSVVQLQCAHINSRRFSATRADLRNAFCLCAGCHRFTTDFPREFSKFITNTWAQEYYDAVYTKSRSLAKVDWQDRLDFLKDIKQTILEGEITIEIARTYEE